MTRYFKSFNRYSDFALERYTNPFDGLFIRIGMYSSYKNGSYVNASSFDDFHSIMKEKLIKDRTLKYTFANRGHKIIRDRLNKTTDQLFFKKEAVFLGKKSKLKPIQLPKRSNKVIKTLLEYILEQEDSFIRTCINYLRAECNICGRFYENERHCSQSMLGFQYQYLISSRLNKPAICELYNKIEAILYQSPLNISCISG